MRNIAFSIEYYNTILFYSIYFMKHTQFQAHI